MATAKRTTSSTSRTSTASTAKSAEEIAATESAKATAVEDSTSADTAKSTELKEAEAKVEDIKADDSGVIPSDKVEGKVERNPELDGGVDKVADQGKEDAEARESDVTKAEAEHNEEQRERFLTEGIPTSEVWDDPQVNIASLPANFDPVVSADHATASSAMAVDQGKLAAAAPVQISNFDNSDLSRNVMGSMSAKATVEVKDSDKSK